jgi:hypothetical protein
MTMSPNDPDTIAIAREHFLRADQGRPDIQKLFHEDAEIDFPNVGSDSDATRSSKEVRGSMAPWNAEGEGYRTPRQQLAPTAAERAVEFEARGFRDVGVVASGLRASILEGYLLVSTWKEHVR